MAIAGLLVHTLPGEAERIEQQTKEIDAITSCGIICIDPKSSNA